MAGLVLSRLPGESIVIATDGRERLRLTVDTVRGDKVRIRFEGDSEMEVDRLEIWERKQDGELPKEKVQ